MASNIKITDARIGNSGKVGLVIEEGASKYVLSSKGLHEFTEHAALEAPKAITGVKAESIIESALGQMVSKPEALPEQVRGNLNKIAVVFPANAYNTPLLDKLAGHTAVLDALATGDKAALETALNASPTTLKLLTKDQLTAAEKLVDVPAITKAADEATKAAEALTRTAAEASKAKADLAELLKAKKPDYKAIDALLDKNLAHLDELATVTAPHNVNLKSAIAVKQGEIITATAEAQTLSGKLANLVRDAEHAELLGNVEGAKDLRTAAETAKKDLTKIVEGRYGSVVKKGLDKDVLTRISGHDASFAAKLGAEGAEAGKKGFRIWTKAPEDLAKFVEGDLKGIKGVWNKRTLTGKAALVGVPVVAVAYLAGVGGKGKHTDQVMEQKLNAEPSVGVA